MEPCPALAPLAIARLRELGAIGAQWLEDLPEIVKSLAVDWQCSVGESLPGASAAFVAEAVDKTGRPAVLKVTIPDGGNGYVDFHRQARVLALGGGYVEVYEVDYARRALLMERLGPSLDTLGLSVETQIDVVAATLRPTWNAPPDMAELTEVPTGADQARSLRESITADWSASGQPCQSRTVDLALQYITRRIESCDRERAVLIHADGHPANILKELTSRKASGFKLIDPEGIFSEPAHDLAIALRGWNEELLASSNPSVVVRRWCRRMADAVDVDCDAVWEWAFTERVSTGLLLARLGDAQSIPYLRVADMCATDPNADAD